MRLILNRYETATSIAETYFLPHPTLTLVATGQNFPDALAGAALAGRLASPIILTIPTSISQATADGLLYLLQQEIEVLGGTGAVSATVAGFLVAYIFPFDAHN